MKKNMIALLLSIVIMVGSIGNAPVLAAEATVQESTMQETDLVEENEADENSEEFDKSFNDEKEDSEKENTETDLQTDTAIDENFNNTEPENTLSYDDQQAEQEDDVATTISDNSLEYEDVVVEDETFQENISMTRELSPEQRREFQGKIKTWMSENQITIVYDSAEKDLHIGYRIYSEKSDELLHEGFLSWKELSRLYYETVDLETLQVQLEESTGDGGTINFKGIPVRIVLNDGSNEFEENVSEKIESVAITDIEPATEGQVVVTWSAVEGADGYSILVQNGTVQVYETTENQLLVDGFIEDCTVLVAPYQFIENSSNCVKQYGMASSYEGSTSDGVSVASAVIGQDNATAKNDQEQSILDAMEVISEDVVSSEAKNTTINYGQFNNISWVREDNTITISGTGEMTSTPKDYNSSISTYYTSDFAVVIKNGVTSIKNSCFQGCTNLVSVSIPSSVTKIGGGAFFGCSGLSSVVIPPDVETIEGSTFCNCTNLRNVVIPYGVTRIESNAFSGCTGLTSITIPSSVESIGNRAFYGCTNLKNITISSNATSIGIDAFGGTPWIKAMDDFVIINHVFISYQGDNTEITIPSDVTGIGSGVFSGNTNLTGITIPSSVTYIGEDAFRGCSNLSKIEIPSSVTTIEDGAFCDCSNLSDVIIPDTVTKIGNRSFSGTPWVKTQGDMFVCNNALLLYQGADTEVRIPDGVTEIGDYAFYNCTGLTGVSIPSSVTTIGKNAFYNCKNLISVDIPSGVKSIGANAFANCSSLDNVTIPMGVKSIEQGTFDSCSNLTRVMIPSSVTNIGQIAFRNCVKLSNVNIPSNVEKIGIYAFSNCNSITSVTIPKKTIEIEPYTFEYCKNLTNITILNGVTGICHDAFNGCSNLKDVKVPLTLTSIGRQAFYGCAGIKDVHYEGDEAAWNLIIKWDDIMGHGRPTLHYNCVLTGTLDLASDYSCPVGNSISISATYSGNDTITSADVTTDAGDSLEISGVSIMESPTTGNGQDLLISFMVTGKKEGEYNLTLTASDGTSASTALKVFKKYDIADAEVVLLGATYIDEEGNKCFNYTGEPIEPVYTVRLSNKPVAEKDKDYTMTYEGNTEIGTARCILEGIGDYYGKKIAEFRIVAPRPEFKSIESEFPGSCTVVVNKISQSAAYKLDIQKDGNSIEGYPKEIEDISTSDGSSATDSFTEYADHLKEGETYTIRVCAIAKIGRKEYQSDWTEGEVKTLLTSFKTRYPYILAAGKMECYLEFPTSGEREIEFTGKGAIRVKDEFGEDVFVINEPLSDYVFGSDDSDSDAMIENGVIHISLNMNQPARALSPTPQKNKLLPGHHYYITIDPSTIGVGNNHDYSGSQEKDKWTFETMNFEIPAYINDSYIIPGQYMDRLYKPDHANTLKAMDPNPGRGGICYGFCAAALAWNKGYPRLKSLKESKSIDHLGNMPMEYTENPNPADNTLFNYIVLQHLVQLSDDRETIKNEHVNDIDTILRKVKAGEYFLLDLNAGEGNNRAGHTVIPLGYKEDTDGTVHLYCYNCEYEKSKCFVDELTIRKVNGKLSYWYWSDKLNAGINNHAISWTDFDQSYDDLTQIQKGNLAYTNITLTTNPQAIEINGTRAATEASEDQNGFDRYYYWYKDNVMEVSSVEDSPLILSLSDGYINYSGTVNGGTVFISLEDDCVRLTPNNEGEECSFTIQNWEDYDESTKIKVTAGGSEQTTLKQTDDGWTLEGAEPGTITIIMESEGIDDGEEITNKEEITVESTTRSVEIKKDDYNNLKVVEDTDGDGKGDKNIGSMERPSIPGKPITGKCGENLTWTLGNDRVLRISGTGAMNNYTNKSPWSKYDFTSVVIENGVTGIGNYAFSSCSYLRNVSIPPSLENIGQYAFLYPVTSKNIYITDLEAWLKINDASSALYGQIFLNNRPLTEVSIPNGLTTFKRGAFDGCSKLTSVIIPEGIQRIPGSAFGRCTNLKSVELPNSVTSIWSNAFSGCASLNDISLPESLTRIANNAFSNCKSLTSLRIPSSLAVIDYGVFDGCTGLKDVYYNGSENEWAAISIGESNEPLMNASIHYNVIHLDGAEITEITDAIYSGKEITRKPVVKIGNITLEEGIDYTVSYKNNTNAGTASVIITGIGNYTGSVTETFVISPRQVNGLTISGITAKTYNGKAQTQAVTVKDGNITLEEGTDYTVSYKNNTNAGTASVVIKGEGNYTKDVTKTFTIKKTANTITAKSFTKTYSTKAQTFDLGVKIKNGTPTYTSNSKSVTVSKAGKVTVKAKFIGKATITITAPEKTNYSKQTKKITITVIPTKTALSSVTSPSAGKMTVKWKKNAVGNGYQIQYSTSSKFTSLKSATIAKNTTLTKTIGSLTKGKKYYVRIRTYKTVGSTKFYSAWSMAKTVTIKK